MYAVIHGRFFVKQKRLPQANRCKLEYNQVFILFSICYMAKDKFRLKRDRHISLDRQVIFSLYWGHFCTIVRQCVAPRITPEITPSTPYDYYKIDKMKEKKGKKALQVEKRERAMIEGILEGSPDGIGVVVVRLECGCRKMAAVSKDGEPASKIIMYRDQAEAICAKCKEDNGSFVRVTESFIHWVDPAPSEALQEEISLKVLGSHTAN